MRLRLVTLNTWALPWKLSFDVEARMQSIAHAIAELQPDIVMLQELWNRGASRRLIDALSNNGLRHQWTDGLGLGNGGLAVASRYPISHARFTRFRVQGRPERVRHGDYYGGKGFVEALVDLGGQSVTVVNTHLHSRHVSSAPHLYTAERTAQAVELAVAMKHAPSPCVAAGDFNMSPTDNVYDVFRALSGCSDAAVDCGNPSTTHFHRNSGRRERLDYVFVRNSGSAGLAVAACARALDEELIAGLPVRRYSDHAAVVVDFETPAAVSPRASDDEARRNAIATAEAIVRDARRAMAGRQGRQRIGAAAGLSLVAGGVVVHRKVERRAFVRTAAFATVALAGLTGSGLLALSETSSRQDLAGFDHVLELLQSTRVG